MSKQQLVLTTVALALAFTTAACGNKTSQMASATRTAPAIGVPVRPFEPLPIAAYEGAGVADLGTRSLRTARDVAYAQAYRLLSQDVVTLHVNRITELVGPGHEEWVSPVGTTVSRALLVGKKFTEELQVGDRVWVRVYMAKAEVDSMLIPSLQRMAEDLAPAIREAYVKDLRGVTPVDEELKVLSEFQRRRGRATP